MPLVVPGFMIEPMELPLPPPKSQRVALNVPLRVRYPSINAALERGEKGLTELRILEEIGTQEEIITDQWLRGARMRMDVLKTNALAAWEWKYGGVGFRMMLLKAKMMKGRGE